MSYIQQKRIFYINSRNRITGSDNNFTYKLETEPGEEYDRAVVLQCSIPKSYYLIESGYNTFTLKEDTSSATITIPPGSYTRKSFQQVLSALLTSNSPNNWTYVITYPSTSSAADTGKYTYTVSGNGATQPQIIVTTNVFEQLGFNANTTNTFVGNSLTSTNVIKLQAEDTIYIHSDLVTNGIDNILQEVFVNGDPTYASINFSTPSVKAYAKVISMVNSNIFNFYITDEDGQPIDLNGQNMQIVLMLYKENDVYRMVKGVIKYYLTQEEN